MIVVIDTNCLLNILSLRHPHGVILDAWMDGRYDWAISNEVLSEYEEITRPRIGERRWNDFLTLLNSGAEVNGNLIRQQPDFRFQVIKSDLDDNKFIDCAITANAQWIITHDRHFDVLAATTYRPRPIRPDKFMEMMNF